MCPAADGTRPGATPDRSPCCRSSGTTTADVHYVRRQLPSLFFAIVDDRFDIGNPSRGGERRTATDRLRGGDRLRRGTSLVTSVDDVRTVAPAERSVDAGSTDRPLPSRRSSARLSFSIIKKNCSFSNAKHVYCQRLGSVGVFSAARVDRGFPWSRATPGVWSPRTPVARGAPEFPRDRPAPRRFTSNAGRSYPRRPAGSAGYRYMRTDVSFRGRSRQRPDVKIMIKQHITCVVV
jgi:hypothetical protein